MVSDEKWIAQRVEKATRKLDHRRTWQNTYRAKLKAGAQAAAARVDEKPPGVIRTIELRTFPRLDDWELAALFGMPFAGEVTS